MNNRVARCSMFVTPTNPRFIDKAWTRGGDVYILDIEDSIAPAEKERCRTLIRESIQKATTLLRKSAALPVVLVDCSHGNSGKKHDQQTRVAADLSAQVAAGEAAIIGVMLESNLVGGSQPHDPKGKLTYGQSITDACLSFDETVPVLEQLAAAATARRLGGGAISPAAPGHRT